MLLNPYLHMKNVYPFVIVIVLLLAACKTTLSSRDTSAAGELIFQSGFEKNTTIISTRSDADIIGADQTFSSHRDWVADFDNHPLIGNFNLQYHKGDSTMRQAKIVAEPGNPANHVMQFWLHQPSEEQSNGRMQANLYNNKGMKEFYQSVRLFLSDDFHTVKKYPKEIHWLTIAEYWNNITWSQNVPYGFRITLGIGKTTAGESDLHFIVDAQDCELFKDGKQKYTTIWAETNTTVKVPIGKWCTMEYYYKEGNRDSGRYYMAMTPEGEKKQVIFNIKNITHNTTDPAPGGVTDFNPMKLYTSKDLVNYMRAQGKTLQVYWDDFKLWQGRQPR
jgi:hypothetical protein